MAEGLSLAETLAVSALTGITGFLAGADDVPAGTAAARPPVQAEMTIFGISQKVVIVGLVVILGALLLLRK